MLTRLSCERLKVCMWSYVYILNNTVIESTLIELKVIVKKCMK